MAQRELCDTAEHEWDEVHVALGVAVYDPEVDYSATDTERRADKIMYENKRARKVFDITM
jgi:PleD family two-component response regulator